MPQAPYKYRGFYGSACGILQLKDPLVLFGSEGLSLDFVHAGRKNCSMQIDLHIQCRHLIPALNAWAVQAYYTTARPIDTQFHGHGCVDYLQIERRCYQIATLRSLMCFDHFWHVIHGVLYNQALADVRSTGAGTKCLYCRFLKGIGIIQKLPNGIKIIWKGRFERFQWMQYYRTFKSFMNLSTDKQALWKPQESSLNALWSFESYHTFGCSLVS